MRTTTPDLMPTLSAGRHRTPRQGACFMEFASFLAGERWSDHPACTHPLLAALARDVNDLTADSSRDRLMPLVTRVIGLTSRDPLVTAQITVLAAATALPIVALERQRALAAGLLSVLHQFDEPGLRATVGRAFELAPHAQSWAQRYLASARIRSMPLTERTAQAIVHTATVGIAVACVEDPEAILAGVLESAIEACERRRTGDGALSTAAAPPAAPVSAAQHSVSTSGAAQALAT